MTDLDPGNIVVGISDGPGLWFGAANAVLPSGDETIDPATWTSVGYISDDETPTVSQELSTNDIPAWQTQGLVRRVLTSRVFSIGFTMIEVNPLAMALWFDTEVPEEDDGSFSLALSSTGAQQERAALLQVRDGDQLVRYHFPRVVQSEAGDVTFTKGEATGYPVKLTALDVSGSPGTFVKIVEAPPVPATGATAGIPGTFTPSGAVVPADIAALDTIVANPVTVWTVGQYVALGDASHAYWDSNSWEVGEAPA